jgi:hypothetical protein
VLTIYLKNGDRVNVAMKFEDFYKEFAGLERIVFSRKWLWRPIGSSLIVDVSEIIAVVGDRGSEIAAHLGEAGKL